MKKNILLSIAIISFASCSVFSSLNSNTSIKPKERFVLGNNKHGSFKTHLKNEDKQTLKSFQGKYISQIHLAEIAIRVYTQQS